ncbi:hypothetical protein EKO27_g7131, partial [Xylaria grammica]
MASTHPQYDDGDAHLLPSTFSPWRGVRSNELADNGTSTAAAAADAARPSVETTISPSATPSLATSEISTSTLGGRGSSDFYSPRSLDVAPWPPTTSPRIAMSHSASIRSAATAQTISEMSSSETERLSPADPTEQSIPAVSDVNALRSTSIMPMHPGAESIPMSAMYNATPLPNTMVVESEHGADEPSPQLAKPYFECYSRQDAYIKRWSWLYITLIVLSIYSTVLSGIWLIASIVQPRYGRGISTGKGVQISPSTATLLATLAAKTIELSFVTVFVAVLGQVLTRRAFSRLSRGVTLAEMTMRNWVIQPGSLLTHWNGIPYAVTTFLGALTLTASICALLYTTASDAMVSPKLSRSGQEMRDLLGLVKTSYANPRYISYACQTPLGVFDKTKGDAAEACLNILYSGQSYHSFTAFMAEWDGIYKSKNSTMGHLSVRPTGKYNLFDNTTMDSSWIEKEEGDIATNFDTHRRIINNVTLAVPHAGVYAAATDPINGILQPSELLGLGEYSIRASVVSPVVNVMCVNMEKEELAPLVYTEWPAYNRSVDSQQVIPSLPPTGWRNHTVVDDIFKWTDGNPNHQRPYFPLYPIDNNMVTFASDHFIDALYILAKGGALPDYTLCELRSWITPKCSTAFNLSGISGGHMKAHCEDANDVNAYERVAPQDAAVAPQALGDWKNVATQWQLAINLGGGLTKNNASNALVLTELILDTPMLNPSLPSMAEASPSSRPAPSSKARSTTVAGGVYESFRAEVQTQQYASAHTASWQGIFYVVLGLVFVLNVLCLLYLAFGTTYTSFTAAKTSFKKKHRSLPLPASLRRKAHEPEPEPAESDSESEDGQAATDKAAKGLVTDYTEPQNLFVLAVNSPP